MPSRSPPRPPAAPPASAAEAAPFVRDFVVRLYDRQDGEGVNKRLVADTLFRAAFDALDGLPVELRRTVARLVHEGSYRRMTDDAAGDSKASKTDPAGSVPAPSNAAVFQVNCAAPAESGPLT